MSEFDTLSINDVDKGVRALNAWDAAERAAYDRGRK